MKPAAIAAVLVVALYAGLGLSVQFPRVAFGLQSDESTYYMMAYSLAQDGDLVYKREDLTRVWRDFDSGPSGVFLKRGSDLHPRVDGTWPFIHLDPTPDPDTTRLFYGKSAVYPVFVTPFVALAGTNGFVVFHALLLGLMTWAACEFLSLRMPAANAVLLGTAFVLATVVPAYSVWVTPELFNLACVLLGYFCWLYKERADVSEALRRGGGVPAPLNKERADASEALRRGAAHESRLAPSNKEAAPKREGSRGWLSDGRSDIAAAILLGLATASKPTNILLMGPPLLWYIWKRQWTRAFVTGSVFALVVGAFFGATMAVSGEWNFQGGDRRTFYGAYPFQTPTHTFEATGADRATDRLLTEIIFGPDFWIILRKNIWWFLVGRYSGLLPYFFPAVFALTAFLLARGRRAAWQYLVLAVALAEIVLLLVTIPYNYFGGGGVLGNRYFMNIYGLFLFLLPPLQSVGAGLVPWIVGSLFTAQITLNAFFSSFYPNEHAKRGPLRWLPVELSLVNELPVNTDPRRARIWFGERPRFQIYFLDDNAYDREENSFWVRGESRADLLFKSAEPAGHMVLELRNGPLENEVTVRTAGERQVVTLQPRQEQSVMLNLGDALPYQGRFVWGVSIASARGFVPMFEEGGTDNRYLGVFVRPELEP